MKNHCSTLVHVDYTIVRLRAILYTSESCLIAALTSWLHLVYIAHSLKSYHILAKDHSCPS